ncbi:MAG: serine/threonine protein kinase, partial [Deltaproteobacteria bacterium]|nr:serine/threonine protein kinase [Deltaproteobacteria bacterium]
MSGDRANKRDEETAHASTKPAVMGAPDPTASDADAFASNPSTPGPSRASLPPILATRYELKRVIGVGGMGLVYEALDLNLHRMVALKVLKLAPTKAEERADAVNRLVREARAMAALSHKNVVTVHDVGYHEDQVFVAMQLVEGTTMRAWLQQQKRGLYQILNVLYEAGSGLAAAHSARLIHRDFKPDNILVSQRGTVRVTDFGLARRSDGLIEPTGITPDRVSAPGAIMDGDNVDVTSVTRSGAIVGTPAYMAPEQAAGASCDARADQFSFCVTAWEALYGVRPFAGKNWSEIYSSVQKQTYALPKADRTVPRALQKALRRGLAVEPAERFASMVEL